MPALLTQMSRPPSSRMARSAAAAIEAAGPLPAFGFFTSAVTELAVASSTGLAVKQRMTDASALVVAADEGRSGYAEQTAWRAGAVDPAAVGNAAAAKAEKTAGSTEIEPGTYRAVLEPYALADLIEYFAHDSFGALGLIEERSYLSGRLGQQARHGGGQQERERHACAELGRPRHRPRPVASGPSLRRRGRSGTMRGVAAA